MQKKLFSITLAVVMALSMILMIPSVGAQGGLGSADNPIQVYFLPSGEAQTIIESGEVLAQALKDATGYEFEVFVPTAYGATVEAMCASPDNTMAFISALPYVKANDRCGVKAGAAAVRFGSAYYWAQYVVRRDSDIYVLGDLEGKTWGYGDPGSTSGFLTPSVELQAKGITPGDQVQTGGHNQTILAVYNGEVDFGTTYFTPPVLPGAAWQVGDIPEPFDLSIDESYIGEDGELYVGEANIRDARRAVRETAPDVVDQVRILAISDAIPNDTLSFGPEFPEDVMQEILDALFALAENEEVWNATPLSVSYSWNGMAPVSDEAYDPIRLQIEILGLTDADIFGD